METLRKFTTAWAAAALAVICAASFGLMLWASRTDSAIMDEQAHIPAGYGYVRMLDYRLNPEHPPLVKALAMLPVMLFVQPAFPVANPAWTSKVNGEWAMGYEFLYHSGNDPNAIVRVGRIMPILLTILAIILVWFLARRTLGPLWALLPTILFGLDPAVLANGHYVTTDVGAAFGIVLSLIFFLRFADDPSAKNLWYAGIAFGIAQLTKFSAPLLGPLYIFLGIALLLRDVLPSWNTTERVRRMRHFWRRCGWWAGRVALVFIIGYAVIVYPAYFLFTSGEPVAKQAYDTQAILGSFAGGPTPAGQLCHGMRCLADADIWMSHRYVTRPIAQYMLGILMVLQRVDGGNTIYFLGKVRETGGWIYFPALFLLKEPLPSLIIVLIGIVLAAWWTLRAMRRRARDAAMEGTGRIRAWCRQFGEYIDDHFTQFSLASFIALYWGYSMHSPLNIGIRHLMPTIPLIFILAAGAWRAWIMRFDLSSIGAVARSAGVALAKYAFLVLLLAWFVLEVLFTAPYFLSYFNELGGGTWGGYHFVTDSNYDWGQDLLRLRSFVDSHPEIDKIGVDYFGGGNPAYYLGNKEVNWSSRKGNPVHDGIHWLAVSVNTLELATQPLSPNMTRNASDTYSWLTAIRPPADATGTWLGGAMGNLPPPDYRIGTSIFVYHL